MERAGDGFTGKLRQGRSVTEIRTSRLLLRRARPGDLTALHSILSDAEAMRYWSTLPHSDISQSRAWLEDMIAAPAGESDDFIIERDGEVIGKAGCWRLPEIGYILDRSAWGFGYATEALRAATAHVFAHHAIPEIVADVDPRNIASLALLAKIGFQEAGRAEHTMQVGGDWVDSIYLALKRPD
jgi:ribosomal-protein-alanine N-acetyltransferase